MKPQRIYIAASFPRKAEAHDLARMLQDLGHLVVSRWHDENGQSAKDDPALWPKDAPRDVDDVLDCDIFLCLTGDTLSRGGRHTELGIALSTKKKVIILGPREQVFHALPCIDIADKWEDLRCMLDIS